MRLMFSSAYELCFHRLGTGDLEHGATMTMSPGGITSIHGLAHAPLVSDADIRDSRPPGCGIGPDYLRTRNTGKKRGVELETLGNRSLRVWKPKVLQPHFLELLPEPEAS